MSVIDYISKVTEDNGFLLEQVQGHGLTRSMISQELGGLYGSATLRDLNNILHMYQVYELGAEFTVDASSNDWTPSAWRSKQIKALIDKEARFLFSEPPDITLRDTEAELSDNTRIIGNEQLLNRVLKQNRFASKLIRAAKDCLIGKRVAITVNFNASGIDVAFVPSLEFLYETDPSDVDRITKFIQIYAIQTNDDKALQRIYKKKWYMDGGVCRVVEEIYDGSGRLVETLTPDSPTRFSYIPAFIVINDGLTGDPFGVSDVEALEDTEAQLSKLSSKDMDSLRKGTDQITYGIDLDPATTKGLSRAPGSFWDLATDVTRENASASVGTLDNPMSYSGPLDTTINRLKTSMFSQLDVPDTYGDALQGVITSGKTMQAIYWGLMVRCNEKMLDWAPAFESMAETIIEGGKLYPEIARMYTDEPLVEGYVVQVTNSYPILQDETEEKASDMLEVQNMVLSRKSYIKKWRPELTNADIDAELAQIAAEQAMLEHEPFPAYETEPEPDGEGGEVQ